MKDGRLSIKVDDRRHDVRSFIDFLINYCYDNMIDK